MNWKYFTGIGIAVAFIVIALLSFQWNKIEYSDIAAAKASGKKVQIIGSVDRSKSVDYNHEQNQLTFYMIDEKNIESKVIFAGSQPNNFSVAPSIVVKGQYRDSAFYAIEILTKCPSKYETQNVTSR
jgi:cytochrome c-type biogenesis protein CcmE